MFLFLHLNRSDLRVFSIGLIVFSLLSLLPVMGQLTHTVVLRVLDNNGEPVPFALIRLKQSEVRCGPDGRVTLELPAGDHAVEAFFMGVSVARSSFHLPGISAHDIVAKVFSLRVSFMDQGVPVPGAVVRVYVSEESREAIIDASGMAVFKQLPASALSIHVFKDGRRESEGTITLDRNDVIFLERIYYYMMRFYVIDKEKLPARNVKVQVGVAFNLTDERGMTMVEAKKGAQKLEMTMYGLAVYSSTLNVVGNDWFNVTVAASSLLVNLLDETGQPYIGAVTVHIGRMNLTSTTDASGSITMKQIPYGEIGLSTLANVVTKLQHNGKQINVNIVTRELRLVATLLCAYQLGSMRIRILANIGELPLKRTQISVVSATGIITTLTDSGGIVEVDVPIYLENPATALVKVTAYGQEKTSRVTAETSPLMLFIIPLGLFPLILFKILTRVYRRTLPPST